MERSVREVGGAGGVSPTAGSQASGGSTNVGTSAATRATSGPSNVATVTRPGGDDVSFSGPTRMFDPGKPITPDVVEASGLVGDREQLSLERNALYRDQNPQASFKTPGLNEKIDQMTGTRANTEDPAQAAANVELSEERTQSAKVLRNYESTAKINEWRAANADKIKDGQFPARLSSEQIAAETSKGNLQNALNAVYAEKGMPMSSDANVEKYGSLKSYQPNPRFDDKTAFDDAEKAYVQQMIDWRSQLPQ